MKLLRKVFLLGLGVGVATKEAIEAAVDNLIKRGELAQEERGKAIESLLREAEEERKKFTETIKESVQKAVSDMGMATRKDIEELKKRFEAMEERFAGSGRQRES